MRAIIIGLGNFGSSLGYALMAEGHEVIGVDLSTDRVDKYKDDLTYTVKLDTTEASAMKYLPWSDTDCVVIAIGENVGSSITTIAQIIKVYNGKIIARSINDVHHAVLESMNVKDIVEPETEFAKELSKRIMIKNVVKSMDLPGAYEIAEIPVPKHLIGKTIIESNPKANHGIFIITTIKLSESKNIFGSTKVDLAVTGILHDEYRFEDGDLIVLFGKNKDIQEFAEEG